MKKNKEVRDAYVEAEITSALAHQIRAMRMDRDLTQAQLAKQMKTTQAAISRLEDPSYGKLTLQTLFELSHAFDTGLRVEFVSTLNMLNATYKPNEAARHVPSFEEESVDVTFYSTKSNEQHISLIAQEASYEVHSVLVLNASEKPFLSVNRYLDRPLPPPASTTDTGPSPYFSEPAYEYYTANHS